MSSSVSGFLSEMKWRKTCRYIYKWTTSYQIHCTIYLTCHQNEKCKSFWPKLHISNNETINLYSEPNNKTFYMFWQLFSMGNQNWMTEKSRKCVSVFLGQHLSTSSECKLRWATFEWRPFWNGLCRISSSRFLIWRTNKSTSLLCL